MLVNGMSQVSGSLDEEDAEDITKGIVIQMSTKMNISLVTVVEFHSEAGKIQYVFPPQ